MHAWLQRQEAIFSQAVAMPADRRDRFLSRACAGNEPLRQRVAELVRVDGMASAAFTVPAVLAPEISRARAAAEDLAGARLGRYLLVQKLGEGSSSVVYEAEQEGPSRRRVAVKLIRAGADQEAATGRWETEQQALVRMNHPNIARVFDAGTTESGRLFVVLELLSGSPPTDTARGAVVTSAAPWITRYCDARQLDIPGRLRLFARVCDAVHHAHQRGILHRDLKPSNILVAQADGRAQPKVIDFGTAQATPGRRALGVRAPRFGTPVYMSPEQADGSMGELDGRSDVFSLGVLLSELLVGTVPSPRGEWGRWCHASQDAGPTQLSALFRSIPAGQRTCIARRRGGMTPAQLIFLLRGALDAIVARALARERSRRHATAGDLGAEIEQVVMQRAGAVARRAAPDRHVAPQAHA